MNAAIPKGTLFQLTRLSLLSSFSSEGEFFGSVPNIELEGHEMETEALKTGTEGPGKKNPESSCFESIYKYKFQDNEKFIEGWEKVRDVIPKEKLYESLVKAEVYFYSREVEHVDFVGYKKWLQDNGKEIQELDLLSADRPDKDGQNNEAESPQSFENGAIMSMNDSNSEIKCTDSVKHEDVIAKHPANFIELIEMIQSGKKLPDTEDLNIEPLNIDPTPCHTQRPKKPWEVS